MDLLPSEIIRNVIQFTPLSVQLQINRESAIAALAIINPAKVKIQRVITNYLLEKSKFFRETEVPSKLQIKRFYPMIYRKDFIQSAVALLENSEVYNFENGIATYDAILNIKDKPTVEGFNFIVDILNERELFEIGWWF